MRIAVTLSPTGDWPAILAAARVADEGGLDAVGFWDHYHSEQPEWAYVCGWSAYGALAMATQHIHLVPMVICRLNYTLGVLAKETSVLSIASRGRFELGIGAGDYPPSTRPGTSPSPTPPPVSRRWRRPSPHCASSGRASWCPSRESTCA